jgi:hypothetical protein
VEIVVHHLLLAAGVAALGGAALRIASQWAPRGLERVVAAAPVAVSLAVLWSLVLGLAGTSGGPLAAGFRALHGELRASVG